jgi:hypothetical protein
MGIAPGDVNTLASDSARGSSWRTDAEQLALD